MYLGLGDVIELINKLHEVSTPTLNFFLFFLLGYMYTLNYTKAHIVVNNQCIFNLMAIIGPLVVVIKQESRETNPDFRWDVARRYLDDWRISFRNVGHNSWF